MLCLLALALPIQGAAAATALPGSHAPMSHTMVMPDGTVMDSASMPGATPDGTACPHHAIDKACCGACCGPAASQHAQLVVAPVAERWAPATHAPSRAATPVFLTSGPDRPPRSA
ncbi:MAG: hypothetical protein ABJD97_24210 [Betaproteobacteria bacterium]